MPTDERRPATEESGFEPLLTSYEVPAGHFDELVEPDGNVRPWWASFAARAGNLTAEHLSSIQARITRQIHENSATHTVYATADGRRRPWMLDALPFIVPASEWEALEPALRQHARLLNAIAADLYGPQHLLHEGLLPPAIALRHPGFLRVCHGVTPPGGVFLHYVAFDLARDPAGRWRVANTRALTPAGAGYALENRATMLRMFPDAFRDLQVRPVAPFFGALKDLLVSAAPCDEPSPHVVLLTPGLYSGRYFEHAYLARYFGFPLVEGADLTVRHDRVYLKTISGLRQVHAILKQLTDDYCDPLELRSDSTLGVPGLVQAWRAGRVLVSNAFGTGILESPALPGLLAALCPRLLGEALAAPVLRTWWCGDAAALEDASQLETGVVKPAFPHVASDPVIRLDSASGRVDWGRRLGGAAESSVVEEFLPLSHAPVWREGRLDNRALMLRVFLVADGRGDYRLMAGGLSRIAGDHESTVTNQPGGGSKDTWILSGVPLGSAPPAPRSMPGTDTIRTERAVSSRAAENLFWLGRYAERAETSARLLRTALARLSDPATPGVTRPSFLRACLAQGLLEDSDVTPVLVKPDAADASVRATPDVTDPMSASELTRRLIDNLFDRQSCRSLGFNIQQTVRSAGAIRDRLSSDNWRLLNLLFELVATNRSAQMNLDDALALVDRSIVLLVAVGGLEMAHMPRDHGWRFLSLGRHLERVLLVAGTFDSVAEEDAADPALLEWLLDLSDSLLMFRARYVRQPEWPAVLELLLFDPHNPRSLFFQLAKLGKHVRLLPGASVLDVAADISRLEELCRAAARDRAVLFNERKSMEDLLGDCQVIAQRLSDALTSRYFSHAYELPHSTTSGR